MVPSLVAGQRGLVLQHAVMTCLQASQFQVLPDRRMSDSLDTNTGCAGAGTGDPGDRGTGVGEYVESGTATLSVSSDIVCVAG